MSAASEHRGNALIRRQLDAAARPVEFVMMEELNSLPKYEDAGTPFGEIHFIAGHGGWWAECPKTGRGYWYRTLREAMRRWRVEIHAYENGVWKAVPMARERFNTNALWEGRKS